MHTVSDFILLGLFICLSAACVVKPFTGWRFPLDSYLHRVWFLFLFIVVAKFASFSVGIWILAVICFTAIREYFSLIDVRMQDRLGILGAYICIPFMIYYIQSGWYNMFIITVPVYGFLAVPLLVTLGGKETRGMVFSVGAIDFGLFLFVYCLGHIGYLARFSIWAAVILLVCVMICDAVQCVLEHRIRSVFLDTAARYFFPAVITVPVSVILSPWAGITPVHAAFLGALIPLLALMGHRTIDYLKADLGVDDAVLLPGRGQILDSMESYFFAAPIAFHYYKYFCM